MADYRIILDLRLIIEGFLNAIENLYLIFEAFRDRMIDDWCTSLDVWEDDGGAIN